ncbi:hypothetical protein LTR36_003914 [Oleoguttula mirabilis]|uniref:Uncharacterized protein n=1 Tax=Oleoguttula mirabilis TaxID=1507867 RepID=A0AAV9JH04_9PEZI|nr:hypothetical protein LTR36_003914 [Oleoguttula mirabilis]
MAKQTPSAPSKSRTRPDLSRASKLRSLAAKVRNLLHHRNRNPKPCEPYAALPSAPSSPTQDDNTTTTITTRNPEPTDQDEDEDEDEDPATDADNFLLHRGFPPNPYPYQPRHFALPPALPLANPQPHTWLCAQTPGWRRKSHPPYASAAAWELQERFCNNVMDRVRDQLRRTEEEYARLVAYAAERHASEAATKERLAGVLGENLELRREVQGLGDLGRGLEGEMRRLRRECAGHEVVIGRLTGGSLFARRRRLRAQVELVTRELGVAEEAVVQREREMAGIWAQVRVQVREVVQARLVAEEEVAEREAEVEGVRGELAERDEEIKGMREELWRALHPEL